MTRIGLAVVQCSWDGELRPETIHDSMWKGASKVGVIVLPFMDELLKFLSGRKQLGGSIVSCDFYRALVRDTM